MADTTRINMGRRKMPVCVGAFCHRRVDSPSDEYCRICRSRATQGHRVTLPPRAVRTL